MYQDGKGVPKNVEEAVNWYRLAAAQGDTDAQKRLAAILLADRYFDHGNGTVTDVQTHLQWMRCSLGQVWKDNNCISEVKNYTWLAALDAAKLLNRQGGYASYRDWRVPTKEELKTLIYCSSNQPKIWNDTERSCQDDYEHPTIYQPTFPKTPKKGLYWSSTVYANEPNTAWSVNFDYGYVSTNDGSFNGHVRLVRHRQSVVTPAAASTSSTTNSVKLTNPQTANKSASPKRPVKSSPKKIAPSHQPTPAKKPESNWIKVM